MNYKHALTYLHYPHGFFLSFYCKLTSLQFMFKKYMTISTEQLKHLASLAYLNTTPELGKDLNAIFNFVEHLRQIDTTDVQPLMHPMDALQPLRPDEADTRDLSESLAQIAPQFQDNLYLVPKVIAS